ncbi:hypothetical protein [Kitasatospora terrestris]|uniref:Uncharacterized protein n=1 Tax=Kitasatospora terrestris TaxID=258051 RepID=A0ABP9E8N1_9ACTN
MIDDYPFADGRNVLWELEGRRGEELHSESTLDREQVLLVRHLFDRGPDAWLLAGVYPLSDTVKAAFRQALADGGWEIEFEDGIDYLLGGRQDLPDGSTWRPTSVPAPGPIPPP